MSDDENRSILEIGEELLGDDFEEVSEGHLKQRDIEKGEQFGYKKQS